MIRSRLPADADAEKLRNAVEEGASLSLASNCILDPPKSVETPLNIAFMHDHQLLLLSRTGRSQHVTPYKKES